MELEEHLEIVNEQGEVLGVAPRSAIHGNPTLLHRVVHVLVFNADESLLLQKRSMNKDVAPGRWDTSVGGHVGIGEDLSISSQREMHEELGISGHEPEYLYSYIHRNHYETEHVSTFRCRYECEIFFNREEIDEVRFWSFKEIRQVLGKKVLSDNFENEFMTYLTYLSANQSQQIF